MLAVTLVAHRDLRAFVEAVALETRGTSKGAQKASQENMLSLSWAEGGAEGRKGQKRLKDGGGPVTPLTLKRLRAPEP